MHRVCMLQLALPMALAIAGGVRAAQQPPGPRCQSASPVVHLADLPEASGVAVGRTPGRLWAHNDSGPPVLVALDTRGVVTGRVRLTGVPVRDWEAVAVAGCTSGSCVYVADIGDNQRSRPQITVYRIPEPGIESSVAVKEAFHATYPDGSHDAEALLVTPGGRLYIVTKGDGGPIALYRFPRELRDGVVHRLERVGAALAAPARGAGRRSARARITDGTVSADGRWVVLRTGDALVFHRAADLLSGNWREAGRVDLRAVREAQGEGVAIAPDGGVYVVGEGGGNARPGTFARLSCSVN